MLICPPNPNAKYKYLQSLKIIVSLYQLAFFVYKTYSDIYLWFSDCGVNLYYFYKLTPKTSVPEQNKTTLKFESTINFVKSDLIFSMLFDVIFIHFVTMIKHGYSCSCLILPMILENKNHFKVVLLMYVFQIRPEFSKSII